MMFSVPRFQGFGESEVWHSMHFGAKVISMKCEMINDECTIRISCLDNVCCLRWPGVRSAMDKCIMLTWEHSAKFTKWCLGRGKPNH